MGPGLGVARGFAGGVLHGVVCLTAGGCHHPLPCALRMEWRALCSGLLS